MAVRTDGGFLREYSSIENSIEHLHQAPHAEARIPELQERIAQFQKIFSGQENVQHKAKVLRHKLKQREIQVLSVGLGQAFRAQAAVLKKEMRSVRGVLGPEQTFVHETAMRKTQKGVANHYLRHPLLRRGDVNLDLPYQIDEAFEDFSARVKVICERLIDLFPDMEIYLLTPLNDEESALSDVIRMVISRMGIPHQTVEEEQQIMNSLHQLRDEALVFDELHGQHRGELEEFDVVVRLIDVFREFQSLETAIKELDSKYSRIQSNGTYQAQLEAPLRELAAAFRELEQLMRAFEKQVAFVVQVFPHHGFSSKYKELQRNFGLSKHFCSSSLDRLEFNKTIYTGVQEGNFEHRRFRVLNNLMDMHAPLIAQMQQLIRDRLAPLTDPQEAAPAALQEAMQYRDRLRAFGENPGELLALRAALYTEEVRDLCEKEMVFEKPKEEAPVEVPELTGWQSFIQALCNFFSMIFCCFICRKADDVA